MDSECVNVCMHVIPDIQDKGPSGKDSSHGGSCDVFTYE